MDALPEPGLCTADGPRPSSLAGALSAPPPAVGLPGNGGSERSVQRLNHSGCRFTDDLLAGLESREAQQLKWSLKGGRGENGGRRTQWRQAGRRCRQ